MIDCIWRLSIIFVILVMEIYSGSRVGRRLEALKAKCAKRFTRKVVFAARQPRVDEADNFNASLIVRQLSEP